MKVVLTRNLGSKMCLELGLIKSQTDFKPDEFAVGTEHDFSGDVLLTLQKQNLVEEPAKTVKAVAKEPPVK